MKKIFCVLRKKAQAARQTQVNTAENTTSYTPTPTPLSPEAKSNF